MARLALEAQVRDRIGTRDVRRLRREGVIPAVVYGHGEKAIPLAVDGKLMRRIFQSGAGEHAIIDLTISGRELESPLSKTVIVKEVQHESVRDSVLHVDLVEISLTEKITVNVPIVATGEAVGVTRGGILEPLIRELEIECLPTDMPDEITVDISGMEIGDSLSVGDVTPPPGVEILDDPEIGIFTLSLPKTEKEPGEGEVEEMEAEAVEEKAEEEAEKEEE